jgi:hypothetical protein
MLDRRSIRVAALMLATAAFAAPAASAKPIDSDKTAQKRLEALSLAQERAYMGRDVEAAVPGDDRYYRGADTTAQPGADRYFRGADTTEQPSPNRSFDGADTTQQPGTGRSPDIQIVRREVVASDGWDWDDAAVGAATTAGILILLGASGALVVRRRARPQMQ